MSDEPYAYQIWMCSVCDSECEPDDKRLIRCPKCGRAYSNHDGRYIGEADDE